MSINLRSSDLSKQFDEFRNAVENLVRKASPLIRGIGVNFKRLYQIFQAYVYTLVVDVVRARGLNLRPQNLQGGRFVFKLGTRGSWRRYSYFTFEKNGNIYNLLYNVDVCLGAYGSVPWLNLDVVIVRGSVVRDRIARSYVVFFIECKSGRASPEQIAAVLGQRFLVKRRLSTLSTDHPYVDIVDVLVVRSSASYNVRELVRMSMRWRHGVRIVEAVAPYQIGVDELRRVVESVIRRV